MIRLKSLATVLAAAAPLALLAGPGQPESKPSATDTKVVTKGDAQEKRAANAPRIELALLLDTSNSMDGLINQARAQLWKVVNDLATAEKNGKTPDLRVALYEYGNQGLPSDGGFVREVLGFTDDLDKVSQELFALTTNGGDEYCGRVIESATQSLKWSDNNDDLKLIVIAGNEPFTQGPVPYTKACSEAIAKGIVINTIFCGDRAEGIQTKWEDGAKLADGTYSNINQDQQIAEIQTPFDAELARLGGQINTTFLFFGRTEARLSLATNQAAQDSNAAGLGDAIAAERAATKGGRAYSFQSDLVERFTTDKEVLSQLKDEELPPELADKPVEERKKILEQKSAEREKIQKQISELSEKRKAYIAEERKKQAASGVKEKSLDEALIDALRTQAEKKDFSFEK